MARSEPGPLSGARAVQVWLVGALQTRSAHSQALHYLQGLPSAHTRLCYQQSECDTQPHSAGRLVPLCRARTQPGLRHAARRRRLHAGALQWHGRAVLRPHSSIRGEVGVKTSGGAQRGECAPCRQRTLRRWSRRRWRHRPSSPARTQGWGERHFLARGTHRRARGAGRHRRASQGSRR